jgi:hypothetical protein
MKLCSKLSLLPTVVAFAALSGAGTTPFNAVPLPPAA